jgi:hypothetical protein
MNNKQFLENYPFLALDDFKFVSIDVTRLTNGLLNALIVYHVDEDGGGGMIVDTGILGRTLVEVYDQLGVLLETGLLDPLPVMDDAVLYSVDGDIEAEFTWSSVDDTVEIGDLTSVTCNAPHTIQ